jgi:hypothetical protein
MGRAAIALGPQDCRSCVLDRSDDGLLFPESGGGGVAPVGIDRAGPVLPDTSMPTEAWSCKDETSTDPEIVQLQLWHHLALAERQRFGLCFSSLLLKAMESGTRPDGEVQS